VHADQLDVDEDVVRRLVGEQFPAWRPLGIRRLGSVGTDHTIFRIGTHLAARFSRHPGDPGEVRAALESEAAAVRELAGATTFPLPEPIGIGDPGVGYPLPWSVQRWLTGNDATVEDPAGSSAFAEDLATLISELRAVDTRGRTFQGGGRGGHLPDHDEWMETCFTRSEGLLDVAALRTTWTRLRALPEVDRHAMCHGDLIPPNLLVREGRLAGVLDCGGAGPADPALDLVAAWHVLDDGPRKVLRSALGCAEVQWLRGMAWAFQQAMGLVWYYLETNPVMSGIGRRTLDRILGEEPG
jgi:aminoglycoside phosphotransferase (APT) family kinase protein